MNKRELKKELELFDKKKLIDLISDIYDKNKYVITINGLQCLRDINV